jgi:protein-S-isoprenylcysteine O-methyltransferase Ste14
VTNLSKKALGGVFALTLAICLCVFLPAWTIDYWQSWVLISLLFVSLLGITLDLIRKDPELLERRLHAGPSAETQKSQRTGQVFGAVAFVAAFVIPVLDHRFGWSSVPIAFAVGGDVLVIVGLLVVFLVFRENTFTSATVTVAAEQRVVSTGPYARVRHPMYVGALIMMLGVPIALGSWWGTATIVPMTLVVVRRVREEEELLIRHLSGYREYKDQVRYRLVPLIW